MEEFKTSENINLMDLLVKAYPQKSKSGIKQLIRNGCVKYNNSVVTNPKLVVLAQHSILVSKNGFLPTSDFQVPDIVFEDHDLILINKPSGLLTMGTQSEKENTAYFILSNYVKRAGKQNKIFIVHRLDRDTSGLLLFAKSEEVRDLLQKNWHNKHHFREYFAIVSGDISPEEDTIESYLKENSNFEVFSVDDDESEGAQHAITHYKRISGNGEYSLLSVIPETGRKNQIRVHLHDIGFPIIGDKRYGDGDNPIRRLGLHACKLSFLHPVSGKKMEFQTPMPKSFSKLMHNKK